MTRDEKMMLDLALQRLREAEGLLSEMHRYLPLEGGSYGHTDDEFRAAWMDRVEEFLKSSFIPK